MAINKVYSGNLQTDIINKSLEIGEATGIYIVVPDSTDDFSFECFLQLEINLFENRRIRLTDDIIEIDTTLAIFIPQEYQYINMSKYFAIVTSIAIFIEVYAVIPDKSIDSDNIQQILNKLTQVQIGQGAELINELGQNAALIALGGSIGIIAAPLTSGASLALPAGIAGSLSGGSAAIAGLLGGVL